MYSLHSSLQPSLQGALEIHTNFTVTYQISKAIKFRRTFFTDVTITFIATRSFLLEAPILNFDLKL
ncbi:12816_t:CDS:2 [Dentiscutata erythropus]|uniref:12816_t:CDS:1 n=1 Tax=Dentiscutata erythropus TaxID=1348616 RepID=A0A9N9C991_9GLOM|nr:12816_t:CDS:2 [Dentiscutata erythropus]